MKQEYFLPSYEEAQEICAAYDNFQFYETVHYVDGYKVSSFNYRFVSYDDFNNPIKTKPHIKSFELRGLCFVFNTDGTVFKRYILMNKFFNLNENITTQLDTIKHIPIKTVEDKLDGSLISFIKLPNGKVYAKSKMVLDSDQALAAQKIYETNGDINSFVNICLVYDLVPMFEYVSPFNRIVLKYNESDLVLIKVRDNNNGEYIELRYINKIIKQVTPLPFTKWEEILPLKDSLENKEGFVITLENGMMLKYKMNWYIERHFLRTEIIHREDFLIEKVIKDEIDDIIASVDIDDNETLELINLIKDKVIKFIKIRTEEIEFELNKFNDIYNSSIKDYVINFNGNKKIMHHTLNVFKRDITPLELIKEEILKYTYRLGNAREFLRTGTI